MIPVAAWRPRPSAPGVVSVPGSEAPVVLPKGSGRWMKLPKMLAEHVRRQRARRRRGRLRSGQQETHFEQP